MSIFALVSFVLLIAFYEIYKISANASEARNNAHTYGHSDLDGPSASVQNDLADEGNSREPNSDYPQADNSESC